MLHVFQSDQVEDLVATLAYNLEKSAEAMDVVARTFCRERVVVPNQNLAAYLKYQIAARKGVVANVGFETMEELLESLIPVDEAGEPVAKVVSQTEVTRCLLHLLEDRDFLEASELLPVRRFVFTEHGEESEERRRFQLASRLASLFREYGFSRPEMLEVWRAEERLTTREAHHRESERWQRALWRAIFAGGGLLEKISAEREVPLIALTDIARFEGLRWPERLHIFGFSFLAPFFFQLFEPLRGPALQEVLNLYVMTPCLEAWDDIQTTDPEDEPQWAASSESSIFLPEESPLALRLWGRPGRDFNRHLLQLTDGDINSPQQVERGEYTLLQRLQEVIRHRQDVGAYGAEKALASGEVQDRKSVRFLACPGAQRECEIIASEIWELVNTHENLRFNDIAVVVQPRQRGVYQTHLRAAFEQTNRIPHNVIDIDGSRTSSVLEAVRLLLELPLGRFRRRELLSFLIHPAVRERFGGAERAQWLKWCVELNIFHGADREDFDGTYLQETDRYNWEQGLKRLVLGSFMTQPGRESKQAYMHEGQPYVPLEVGRDGLDGAATLVMAAQMLLADAREARRPGAKRSLGEWMFYFQSLIRTYLEPVDDRDARALMRFQGKLGLIGEGDLFGEEHVGYRTAFDFAIQALSALEEEYGQYLADGVVVSSFRPMRPIPFKVVFVTGLDEGQFPLPEPPDPLDLRNAERRLGDVRRREQDRYMFLETLMSTRARLYLSWVGRDEATGEAREPASVVRELQEMLQPLESQERFGAREVRHPLRRFDERYFPDLVGGQEEFIDGSSADAIVPRSPHQRRLGQVERVEERLWPNHHGEARREAEVRAVRRSLDEVLTARRLSGFRPGLLELREAMEAGEFQRLVDAIEWRRPVVGEAGERPDRVILRIRDLSSFLDCPMQASARVLLRVFDERDEDVFDVDDEPFEADFLTRLSTVRAVFEEAVEKSRYGRADLEEFLDARIAEAVLTGGLPSGVFLDAERKKTLQLAQIWSQNWLAMQQKEPLFAGAVQRVEFTSLPKPVSGKRQVQLEVPVVVDGRTLTVEFRGEVTAFGQYGASLQTSPSKSDAGRLKYMTRALVEQIVLRAAGLSRGRSVAAQLSSKPGARVEKCIRSVAAWSEQEARKYLGLLATEMLSGLHDYFLPVDVADKVLDKLGDPGLDVREEAEAIMGADPSGKWYSAPRSSYGPVTNWRELRILESQEARSILLRRYAPFVPETEGTKKQKVGVSV